MLGVFVALDLFVFYVFWELSLIPMYLIIGIWGGPNRIYATVKFVLYTLVGSLLMLVAILAVVIASTPSRRRDVHLQLRGAAGDGVPGPVQAGAFIAFGLAFAIKVPMWPFHTWLPDAHVEAPTAGSIILAGVLLKLGGYGFLRFSLPPAPRCRALVRPAHDRAGGGGHHLRRAGGHGPAGPQEADRVLARSPHGLRDPGDRSCSTVQGLQGAIFQMVSHGVTTGALFLLVGVIYERTHDRQIAHMGGLNARLPAYAAMFGLFTFASIGLPGLSGFVGEFLVMLGAFQYSGWVAAFAMLVVIASAVYMLWMFQRAFFAVPSDWMRRAWDGLHDMTRIEWLSLAPLVILVFARASSPSPSCRPPPSRSSGSWTRSRDPRV